jgi:multidrug resistance efflux pump
MYKGKPIFIPILVVLGLIAFGAWYLLRGQTTQNGSLKASGTIEAVEVSVASEVSGRVIEILAAEGDEVTQGAPLLRIEDDLLLTQRQQAQAGLEAAQAAQKIAQDALQAAQSGRDLAQAQVDTAQAGLDLAELQFQRTIDAARQAELPTRQEAWRASQPSEFDLPVWYFQKAENIEAAQVSRDDAATILKSEQDNLAKVIADAGGEEVINAEKRLVEAEKSFLVAKDVLDQARQASEGADVQDYAQQLYDAADATLKSAQEDYNRLLSDKEKADLQDARARLTVAQGEYDHALDQYNQLLTGDQSLEVQIADTTRQQAQANLAQAQAGQQRAEASVTQAESSQSQAEAVVAQAQAQLDLLGLQLDRYTVYAPASGVVLVRKLETGELLQPGVTAMTLGQLDNLKITVYLPEDHYGEVGLSDVADVFVDSFPGQTFKATVTRIADKAEFTPRNVQTEEGRKTTYFAIELSIDNADMQLKPGMPADVVFP